jgi:hypothetical protein
VASNVDIAEDARFKFQVIHPVLNHVAMLITPASLPLRSTGMWRTRWRVIKRIRRSLAYSEWHNLQKVPFHGGFLERLMAPHTGATPGFDRGEQALAFL